MISSRYALPVILLLSLALIPTVIHSYLGSTTDDGMLAEKISPVLDGFTSVPSDRNKRWGEDVFDSRNWIERIYRKQGATAVRLFVARSYDQKRLYHHPELALSYGSSLKGDGMVMLPGDDDIPVYLLRGRSGQGLVAYALLYDGRFVKDPIAHQIRDSFRMLFSPRKPMTLFYVSTAKTSENANFARSPAAAFLRAAIDSFRAQ